MDVPIFEKKTTEIRGQAVHITTLNITSSGVMVEEVKLGITG